MNAILLFLGSLGMQEILVIGLVLLVLFGARKIPEFMKGLGRGVREFKDGVKEVESPKNNTPASSESVTPPATEEPETSAQPGTSEQKGR